MSDSFLVVSGETSGDEHTAPFIKELLESRPELSIFGMGGAHMQDAGMELTVDARKSASVMGITEVVGKLGEIFKAFNLLLEEVDRRGTKVALLVDFPDFNLRLAKRLHEKGVKVFYFITPQLWAWRTSRIHQVKKYIEKVFPIIPFEEPFYREHGVDVRYVGHPFLDEAKRESNLLGLQKELGIAQGAPLVALLPGSRRAEVLSLMPVYLQVIRLLRSKVPGSVFLIPVAPNVRDEFSHFDVPSGVHLLDGRAEEVLASCDAGIVASGTATVQAALHKLPFCIAYKVSPLTYVIGKLLIRGVSFIGMPNLIVNREIAKEFIQGECTAQNLTSELHALLCDATHRKRVLSGLDEMEHIFKTTSDKGTVAQNLLDELLPYFPGNQSIAV